MTSRFDRKLVHRCAILSNDAPEGEDDYGQRSDDPSTWPQVATNVPCWIATNAIGRASEQEVEPNIAVGYRRIYMREPTLSNRQEVNTHHFIFANGIYYNVIEVLREYDGPNVHHLEVIVKESTTYFAGEGQS